MFMDQQGERMKRLFPVLAALLAACLCAPVTAQDNPIEALPWQKGPTTVQLGTHASLQVPEGYAFLDAKGTKALNLLMENPSGDGDDYALVDNGGDWVAYFSYADTGYIKDDEQIDADDILDSIRRGTEQSNTERRSRGWEELRILGWSAKPEYDIQLKSLAWSILAETVGTQQKVVNYNTRLLGRYGVMEVVVATAPDKLGHAVESFKSAVPGFQFSPGETYGEYQPGDHVAAYGLAALITGGAAAVAAKKGFFAVIGGFLAATWKFLLIGLAAMGTWFKSLFQKKR
jgi:uncharacterized membrane-anchored protein